MIGLLASIVLPLAQLAAAAADAQVTPRAELHPRASADPSVLGWVSTSGASAFSDLRSCDFPATLSRSGSFAQCCAASGPCNFWTSCSGGFLFAASSSQTCDQGFCNTGVIVATTGAKSGESNLGCWPTSYGSAPITLVQDIGTASVVAGSAASSQASSGASSKGSSASSTGTSGSATRSSASSGTSGSTPNSSGAAVVGSQPLTGVAGLIAGLLALL